ncbi:helix-turn-helix domain-containing protein [Bacillus sp. FDAARGOS_1420]|uniref:helix-turn-helix domain-containing protein n=1 Tax=Bacillus sp. FDAARGOS_1420 TaxID=2856338 RepID=UPI001C5BEEE7|nr:helix-turn-helix domain-containing protein [Bacillus sp. FDAARGOS_1420]MBW3496897.1 helix-turn-helix domain-containing protein [Bacillus sp. FDAARGOS_1420]
MSSLDKDIFIEVPDEKTGEIQQYLLTPTKQKKVYKGDWVMMFQEGLTHVAKLNLKGETLRVYMILLAKLDYENWLRIRQKDLAEELNMKPPHISRAIKELFEHGILVKGPKVGASNTYRLDPSFAFRGRDKNLEQVRKEVKHHKIIK